MKRTDVYMPSQAEVAAELRRLKNKRRDRRIWLSTLGILAVVAAVSVLLAMLALPILEVTGTSMEPTLVDGDVAVCYKTSALQPGDLYCFSYGNRMVIKRVIAQSGDWVDIDEYGIVSVNGEQLVESYVNHMSFGDGDVEYPYQVPDGMVFVLGDNRGTSVDSRYSEMGCLSETDVVGKIFCRIWPLERFGLVD